MADQGNPLVDAARTIGGALGRAVSAVTGGGGEAEQPPQAKANAWQAEYVGSGTFIIHKPKRQDRKRRQTKLRSPRPGMRKS